jgi:WD40 repeat protein
VPPDPALTGQYRWSECARIEPQAAVWHARYAPDGSFLVLDHSGRLVDVDPQGSRTRVLLEAEPPSAGDEGLAATRLAVSGDAHALALWNNTEVRVYRARSGKALGSASGPLEEVAELDVSSGDPFDFDNGCPLASMLSPDGSLFLSHGDTSVCLWDVEHGELAVSIPVAKVRSNQNMLLGFSAAGDAVRVLSGGVLSKFTLDGELLESVDLPGYGRSETGEALTRDAETLVAWRDLQRGGSVLEAIDAASGASRWRHELEQSAGDLTLSTTGYVLARGVAVYDVADGTELQPASAVKRLGILDLSADGQAVLGGDADWLSMVDLKSGRRLASYGASRERVQDLDVSRDGRYLLSMGITALLWELADDFVESRVAAGSFTNDFQWNGSISPTGDSFVVSGQQVLLYPRDVLERRAGETTEFAGRWRFSPDGKLLVGVSDAEHFTVVDAESLDSVAEFPSGDLGGEAAFSPDGALLATSGLDVFDFESGELRWSQRRDEGLGGYVEFSPDGSELLGTGPCQCDSTRYSSRTGEHLGQLPMLPGRPVYSPEGHWVVAAGRLVHLPSGQVDDYAPNATAAVFMPDGRIIAGEADGSLVLYCRSEQ